ncbi:hypothetical protein niasHT_031796 [Heterodera trifolii]|uniref:Uncharacterized protein n=1 Tax=Heterodera trifolii TaxID=157864 RepID=A0ABD2IK15_9BILA
MPRSRSNSSSSDDSTKPNTALLSHWKSSEICRHMNINLTCTKATILSHQMLKFEPHTKFRHHALLVDVFCVVCETTTPRTYDFSGSGKHAKFVLLLL